MKTVKLSDFSPYDRNKGGIQELHHKIEPKTLQYWGEDSGILIGITPIYKIRLWSEEVKVVNDKMTNMKTRTYEGVQHGDWVRCVLCGAQMLLPCGADKCPECGENGTLRWVDEEKQEMDAKDLELVLSRKNPNIEKGKLNFIRYSEMKNWSVRELFGEDLEQADRALINKVYHMLFDIGSDFESVIRMLYSFRNGPKSGIKVADPEDNYEWTNKDGNEKYSTKNLPKAHFRWDWRRYTLSKESVDKITEFVDTILES